jgi:hypothetical protein
MKDPASGTSDLVVNDVGSPKLHEKHRVILEKEEGEVVARARVTDQLEIDRLLLSGKIDTVHHKSAEFLLDVLSRAGAFVKSVNLRAVPSTGKSTGNYNNNLLLLRDAVNCMSESVGREAAELIVGAILLDRAVLSKELPVFREGLGAIDQRFIAVSSK